MTLVNDGREMLCPNERRIVTKISFHQTSTPPGNMTQRRW
jgi:hypothetical protein